MAAFSSSSSSIFQQQQHPFLHPEFLPNSNCFFSQFIQLPNHHHHHHHQNPQIDNHLIDDQQLISTNKVVSATTAPCIIINNEGCCSKKMNTSSHVDNSSSIVTTDDVTTIHQDELIITTTNNKRKSKHPSTSYAQSKDKKREVKGKKQKKMKKLGAEKEEEEEEEEGPAAGAGYIHVRARRGQATDSHSLAERVRRERISERMKLLQSLVPGCDKVTGKALMLDEIINYVQSLQNQVEFLSMKLASLNPMFYDFGLDLESFMVTPHQHLSEVPSPLANMKECSPSAADDYHLLENSLVFQQPQIPNLFSQGSRETLWEVDEHRQKIMNESSSGLFSFH